MTHTVKSRLEPPNHRRVHRAPGLGRKPPILALFGVALLLIAFPSGANAAAGDLDPSFSGDGIEIVPQRHLLTTSVAVDSRGRIVVLCNDQISQSDLVLRFLPNGTLDQSFSGDGRADIPFEGAADSIATDAKDRVVIGGRAPTPGDTHHRTTYAVGRLKADGTPDPSFSGDGQVVTQIGGLGNDAVGGVAIDPQGRIVAAGGSSGFSGTTDFALARYRPNGSPDTSFSGDGQTKTQFPNVQRAYGGAVAIDSKGRIVLAGSTIGDSDDFAVARYTPSGNLDRSFSQDGTLTTAMGGVSIARTVAVDDSDRIVVGGQADQKGLEFALARYKPSGALDPTFSGDGKVFTSFGRDFNIAFGVAIDDQQRIVAAGQTSNDDGSRPAFALARYTSRGALDPAFSEDGRVTTSIGSLVGASGLALDPKGRIVAAGVANPSGFNQAAVARYLSG